MHCFGPKLLDVHTEFGHRPSSRLVASLMRLQHSAFALFCVPSCLAGGPIGTFSQTAPAECAVVPARLRTNNLVNPLGIPTATPKLSWALEATTTPAARNQFQSSYRITCSSSAGGVADLWNSGKVQGAESLQILYNGSPLTSSTRVFWRVEVWDSNGTACASSAEAWFETALLHEADWRNAEWLARHPGLPNASDCDLYAENDRNKAPRFRIEFNVPPSVVSVRAYVSGLGYYQLYVDGARVGDSYLDPGWTTYNKTVLYAVYDLTSALASAPLDTTTAQHAVGIELGNGWWNPLPMRFWGSKRIRAALVNQQGRTSSEPMFKLLLLAKLADGTTHTLLESSRSGNWRAGGSPTTFNNIYLGERYDARLEAGFNGWASARFNDSSWSKPFPIGTYGLGALVAQSVPPIRRQGVLHAKVLSIRHNAEGRSTIVLDTSRNHAGTCRYRLAGSAGDVVSMIYGELLNSDGSVNPMTSVAGQIKGPNPDAPCQPAVAYQADRLTLSGRAAGDDWTPSWSWHGFRYIEVTVRKGLAITDGGVECYPMRTDVEVVSNFSSSDPFLQDLRTLTRNTFDSNMMSLESDCPHRERFGYGGDALGVGEAGLSIYDWSTFYAKSVRDFSAAQTASGGFTETSPFVGIADGGLGPGTGPIGWEAFQPVAQLWLYKYYGDVQTMADSFDATYAYIKLLDRNPPGITSGLGDWMPVEGTSPALTGLGFQFMSYIAFANITDILGKLELAQTYKQKAMDIANALNSRFLDKASGAYHAKASSSGISQHVGSNATQCGQGMALFLGIVPDELREKSLEVMADDARQASFLPHACSGTSFPANCPSARGGPGPHMTAGLFGIKWFLMTLADGGMNDLAYEVLTTESFPGYRWMMNNQFAKATTIWESWFFSDNTFSHNHPMFGSSEVWLLQSVAGIQPHPSARGMDRVLIKPSPPSHLRRAAATFETPRGRISVSWARSAAGGLAMNVSIPPNVVATVHVPSRVGTDVSESGHVVATGRRTSALAGRGASLVVEIGSGDYAFESRPSGPLDASLWI